MNAAYKKHPVGRTTPWPVKTLLVTTFADVSTDFNSARRNKSAKVTWDLQSPSGLFELSSHRQLLAFEMTAFRFLSS